MTQTPCPESCSKLVSFHAYRKHVGKVAVTAILFCASAWNCKCSEEYGTERLCLPGSTLSQ